MYSRPKTFFFAPALVAALVAFLSLGVRAQQADNVNRELSLGLRYVKGLQERGFIDIADMVLADLERKYPEAKTQAAALKLEGQLRTGKFEEVKAVIAKEPKDAPETWAMKLALADAYYAYGKYGEAAGLYAAFFKQYADNVPPSLESFFTESAYKYAQMQLNLKDREGALKTYRMLVGEKESAPTSGGKGAKGAPAKKKSALPDTVRRQCLAEMGDIALTLAEDSKDPAVVKRYCTEVGKWADQLLWVQDLWFGKAIVLKAHALMLQKQAEKAQKLVDDYMPTLTAIHQSLVEQEKETGEPLVRVSPMSECRYLLAVMLQTEAERLVKEKEITADNAKSSAKAEAREQILSLLLGARENGKRKGDGAYNHFLNVYLKYPESQWAADAGVRAEQVHAILTDVFGGNVTAQVTPEQTAKVREIQYRDARALYAQGQIDNARKQLHQVLNSFPDCVEAIPALGDFARCYIQNVQEDPDAELYADTIVGHLAERYSGKPSFITPAGDEVIRLAEYWQENGRPDHRLSTYDLFFKFYPTHSSCASYLFSFGEKAYQDKDYPNALAYFQQVANTYTNSPRALDALSRITSIYSDTEDHTNLIAAVAQYIKALEGAGKPTQTLMTARYTQAQALRNHGLSIVRSGTTNEQDITEGNNLIARSIKAYTELAATLADPPPTAQVTDEERKRNQSLREASLYNMGYAWSQIKTANPKVVAAARQRAIAAYDQLIAEYPKSEVAPAALIQIGSIWSMEKDVVKAEAALSKLRKEYPSSPEAKSALPMLADNLMKLDMREEAVSRYREMISTSSSQYSDNDLLRATRALTDAKEYDLARQALDVILGRTKDETMIPLAKFEDAKLSCARKEFVEACEKVRQFIKDYPNITLVLDANILLSEAASEAGKLEKDFEKRKELFNAAIDAMKYVRGRRTNDVEQAQADIQVGDIMTRKADAEEQNGEAERANRFRGDALVSFQAFIDSVQPNNTRLLPYVEEAYSKLIPIQVKQAESKHPLWEFVLENAEDYIRRFPRGRYRASIEPVLARARIEVGEKAAPAADAPATTATRVEDLENDDNADHPVE